MLATVERAPYTRAQLQRLIAPHSVAIVGASPRPASFGLRTLENLAHFRGQIYPVNAKYERIGEHACYPSLKALPQPPDCALLVVPREGVEQALQEAAAAGAGSAIVYASGYGEMARDESGRAQRRLAEIAQAAGMPLLGPNCMGMVNHELGAGLSFIPEYSAMARHVGPIAFVSQSGALGYCLAQAVQRGVGFRYFFSAGNSADVDVADLIAAMAEDEGVRAVACLFEGVPSARRLLEAGERARAAGKPVIVFKLGTSDDGAAAARSHTGSLAGSAVAFRALFERAGFIPVENFEALVEYAKFFAAAGAPRAPGAAVVSGSGGAGIIAADMAARHGVPMPQPAERTLEVLRSVVPEFGAARNPCDPTGQVLSVPESYGKCCRALLEDPNYGVLICAMSVATNEVASARSATIAQLAREQPKAIAVAWVSEWLEGPGAAAFEADDRIAVFRSLDRCYGAIAAWQAMAARPAPAPARGLAPAGARERAAAIFSNAGPVLAERQAKQVLAAYGVPVVEERLARTVEEALAAAEAIGYPVVLKAESPTILHKTELGVVRLGVRDAQALRQAYREIVEAARGHELAGVLVQPMASGVEVIAGARVDPQVGPLVVVGTGGVLVELLKDSVAALAPVSADEALALLRRLKGFALLEGFRGAPGADLEALAAAIARISELAADFAGELEELDVNPLLCSPQRVLAVDALITRKGSA